MAYLAHDDYSLRIAPNHLDEILAEAIIGTSLSTAQVLANAEKWAQVTIVSYLSSQFNIAAEFTKNAPDASRNIQIMQVMMDLVLCTIHKTINPRQIPEHIQMGCDNAATFLATARDKKLIIDLPPAAGSASDSNVPYPTTFLDSQTKFISKPFQDQSLVP